MEESKLQEVSQVLRIERSQIVDAQWVDNGPGWIGIQLASAEAVLAVEPARDHPQRLDIGLVGLYPPGSPLAYEVRAIFSDHHGSLIEDPVTGSLNASLAQWMLEQRRVTTPYVAAQGARIERAGRIYIDRDPDGSIWVGGQATTLFSGVTGPPSP